MKKTVIATVFSVVAASMLVGGVAVAGPGGYGMSPKPTTNRTGAGDVPVRVSDVPVAHVNSADGFNWGFCLQHVC